MGGLTSWRASGWLIQDTFRQTRAEGISTLAYAVSAVVIFGCLTVTIDPDAEGEATRMPGQVRNVPRQRVKALFGAVSFAIEGNRAEAGRAVHASLAGLVADTAGVLLLLLWTASVLPSFLKAESITVLLVKPPPRWNLLTGKCVGILAFVFTQGTLFVVGTWLTLGWRVGWEAAYLLCLPLMILQFVVFFSFSVMLAVATRSVVGGLFGTVTFWLLCWAMNIGRHAVDSTPDLHDLGGSLTSSVEICYWILPKPFDLHLILHEALGSPPTTAGLINLSLLADRGLWMPGLSVAASISFALVLLVVAAHDFQTADY